MGLILCGVAFLASLVLTIRSNVAGLCSVLTTGYLFGILRANAFPDTYSHFIFDASVLGFFIGFFGTGVTHRFVSQNQKELVFWFYLLLGWTVVMALIPLQHYYIQLVGLRGNGFILPFLLVGCSLKREEATSTMLWLSALNHLAFGFAVAEYLLGVPTFYPVNAVTEIIHNSSDAAGSLRIPACFTNAHSYGGTMVTTIPWLLGAWVQPRLGFLQRSLLASGIVLAMLGVFLCAARTPILLLAMLILMATFSGKIKGTLWVGWAVLLVGIAYVVSNEERMQRFLTLQDTEHVLSRFEGSVNLTFVDLLLNYPLGYGMGAGGTSIPFFLQHLLGTRIGLENEYCRILLEQGVVGLTIWVCFIYRCFLRWPADPLDPWVLGRQLLWVFSMVSFLLALTGIGLMTSIPQSMLFMLGIGFSTAPTPMARRRKREQDSAKISNENQHDSKDPGQKIVVGKTAPTA